VSLCVGLNSSKVTLEELKAEKGLKESHGFVWVTGPTTASASTCLPYRSRIIFVRFRRTQPPQAPLKSSVTLHMTDGGPVDALVGPRALIAGYVSHCACLLQYVPYETLSCV
jgi:hypothetical protein